MTEPVRGLIYQSLFNQIFTKGSSGCLMLPDGSPLHIHYSQLSDVGTFGRAGQTTQKYLKMNPGEVAILNDPYSGGTILSTMTLIKAISLSSRKPLKTDLLIAHRYAFKPLLKHAKHIDEEGLRIPPTPLTENGKINQGLLNTLAEHPFTPQPFLDKTLMALNELNQIENRFRSCIETFGVSFSKPNILSYLKACDQMMEKSIGELPLKDTEVHLDLDPKTRMNLRIELKGNRAVMDFTESDSSESIFMTDAATFGACFTALALVLNRRIPLNVTTFKYLEVLTSAGTLQNARFPSPTFLGMTDGINMTANLVLKALGKMMPEKEMAMSSNGTCTLSLFFKDGRHFFDTINGGIGATASSPGLSGADFWTRSSLQPSIEEIEKRFPIIISKISLREGSCGRGSHYGGNGVLKSYILNENATLHWALGPQIKIEGLSGGNSASTPEIHFVSKGSKTKGKSIGQKELKAGDSIVILSAGGGGYGHYEPPEES